MKKLFAAILTFAVICSLLMPAYAYGEQFEQYEITDERTGITYFISYNVRVSGAWSGEHNENRIGGRCDTEMTFYLPLHSPEVLNTIDELDADLLASIDRFEPDVAVADRWLLDGYEYKTDDTQEFYWRFFELPRDFKGTTVIVKGDVPFTVTGDGEGHLSFKVVTDYVGQKRAEFFIRGKATAEKKITIKEQYSMWYTRAGSQDPHQPDGYRDSERFETLEEALDYCVNNSEKIDMNYPINISASCSYFLAYNVDVSLSHQLNVVYGNTKSHVSSDEDKKTESRVESTVSEVESTVSDTESTVTSEYDDVLSSHVQSEETLISSTGESVTYEESSAIVSSDVAVLDRNPSGARKPPIALIVTISVTLLCGAVAAVILILKRRHL